MDDSHADAALRATVDGIVAKMLTDGLAEKQVETDERLGRDYWILTTPGAFDRELVVVAALGYPEQVGVWSYTLLRQSRTEASSMAAYFRAFAEAGIGFVAINPNCLAADMQGASFLSQLGQAVERLAPASRCGLLGFSMGGGMVLNFLANRPETIARVAGLALIDPTLPGRLRLANVRPLLERDTLLVASAGEPHSPGRMASALLGIPCVPLRGIHGEMPGQALPRVLAFYRTRMT